MISQERINLALEMFERLERMNRQEFSIEDARRRLRILEVLSK
ncbi:Uncharacterised protein [uncultured archaeon]|nr:Uncharacterised protein [uncultured archaeon]